MKKVIRVGSRESILAMWQTKFVIACLEEKTSDYQFEIIPIKTKGDKILDVALAKVGDKGLFTKELEAAMLAGEIDMAVHSMKDVPTQLIDGMKISAILKRHDPHDVLVSEKYHSFQELPENAVIGTSSLRRKSQLLKVRPDLQICDVRGNVHTRLRKMQEQNMDGIILAAAGMERLGWEDKITEKLDFAICLPAVSQGAIGVEIRANDEELTALTALINDEETMLCVYAERALLKTLEGGCQIPIAAFAAIDGDKMHLDGLVGNLDGSVLIRDHLDGFIYEAEKIGEMLAQKLIAQGAGEILEKIRQEIHI